MVIPTRKRREQLQQCLASLAAQTYPRDRWEVIVVEDGEEELPDGGLAAFGERLPLRCFRRPHAGCGIARNTGAAEARGRYLVFTDDDCRFPSDWLSCYQEHFERTPDCVVAGRALNALEDNLCSEATQQMTAYLLWRSNRSPRQAALALGNNFGVPAQEFRESGGFGPRYFRLAAEDRDFCERWLAAGRRIVYAPEIVVHHAHRLNLGSFLGQHFHYGRGAFCFHRLQAERRRSRIKLESPGFYLRLLLWPWSVHPGFRAAQLSLLLLLAQIAHTAGYLRGFLADGGKSS